MNVITGYNVPDAYAEAFWKMRVWAKEENSRNGPVMTVPEPVMLEIINPLQRVLYDPVRNANPFFHLMETVWMLAGSNDVTFVEWFNHRYREYADPDTDIVHGAYGHRWRNHFKRDQIQEVIRELRMNRESRRAVIGMWDPEVDCEFHNDVPCNTHIYFRYNTRRGVLDMTVCNRSNDLVWGMLGANVVHMTYLQELIARATGLDVGYYRVFTNNLHIYKGLHNFNAIWHTGSSYDEYQDDATPMAIIGLQEEWYEILDDAEECVKNGCGGTYNTRWFNTVVKPMMYAYDDRKAKRGTGLNWINLIEATDWRIACRQWVERKGSSSTSTAHSQMGAIGNT